MKKSVILSNKKWITENYAQRDDLLQIGESEFFYDFLAGIDPEYIFLPHYSSKVPDSIYKNFKTVGFHMTDLPFGRGGNPLQNLIVRGFQETQISAFQVEGEMDSGGVYMKCPLSLDGTAEDILYRCSEIICTQMIPFIMENHPTPVPQKGPIVCFSRRRIEDNNIGLLHKLSNVYNYIRMLDCPGYPHAFIEADRLKVEFTEAEILDGAVYARAKITKVGNG